MSPSSPRLSWSCLLLRDSWTLLPGFLVLVCRTLWHPACYPDVMWLEFCTQQCGWARPKRFSLGRSWLLAWTLWRSAMMEFCWQVHSASEVWNISTLILRCVEPCNDSVLMLGSPQECGQQLLVALCKADRQWSRPDIAVCLGTVEFR